MSGGPKSLKQLLAWWGSDGLAKLLPPVLPRQFLSTSRARPSRLTRRSSWQALETFDSVATGTPSSLEVEDAEADFKRKPPLRVGSGRQTLGGWKCPECGYDTGRGGEWSQRKWAEPREAKALLVAWSPTVAMPSSWLRSRPSCGRSRSQSSSPSSH